MTKIINSRFFWSEIHPILSLFSYHHPKKDLEPHREDIPMIPVRSFPSLDTKIFVIGPFTEMATKSLHIKGKIQLHIKSLSDYFIPLGYITFFYYLLDKNSMYTCLNKYYIEGTSPNWAGEYLESFHFTERKISGDQEIKNGQKSLFSFGSLPSAVYLVNQIFRTHTAPALC